MYEDEIPVGKAEDLRGQKFGEWTVLYRIANPGYTTAKWKCQCSCGKEAGVLAVNLKSGKSTKCIECCNKSKADNLIGQRFGRLLVLEQDFESKDKYRSRSSRWKCQCDCGNIIVTDQKALVAGQTQSCGCLSKEKIIKRNQDRAPDLTGQKFNNLTVLYKDISYPTGRGTEVHWVCQCDCGNLITVTTHSLRSGNTKSCGCIKSFGEQKINSLLQTNNISYQQHKIFSSCQFPGTKRPAEFDFYVKDSYLIEYDGSQHFYSTGGWNTQEHVQEVQQRDEYKNQWCKDNNIPLIRIPYTHFDNLCIEDLLLETTQFRVV